MYDFINARKLVLAILFIDFDVRRRIWQYLDFLTIRLNLVIKSMINRASLIGGMPIDVIIIIKLIINYFILNNN